MYEIHTFFKMLKYVFIMIMNTMLPLTHSKANGFNTRYH